jgi:hypothetical protein
LAVSRELLAAKAIAANSRGIFVTGDSEREERLEVLRGSAAVMDDGRRAAFTGMKSGLDRGWHLAEVLGARYQYRRFPATSTRVACTDKVFLNRVARSQLRH